MAFSFTPVVSAHNRKSIPSAGSDFQQQLITRELQEIDNNLNKANSVSLQLLQHIKAYKSNMYQIHQSTLVWKRSFDAVRSSALGTADPDDSEGDSPPMKENSARYNYLSEGEEESVSPSYFKQERRRRDFDFDDSDQSIDTPTFKTCHPKTVQKNYTRPRPSGKSHNSGNQASTPDFSFVSSDTSIGSFGSLPALKTTPYIQMKKGLLDEESHEMSEPSPIAPDNFATTPFLKGRHYSPEPPSEMSPIAEESHQILHTPSIALTETPFIAHSPREVASREPLSPQTPYISSPTHTIMLGTSVLKELHEHAQDASRVEREHPDMETPPTSAIRREAFDTGAQKNLSRNFSQGNEIPWDDSPSTPSFRAPTLKTTGLVAMTPKTPLSNRLAGLSVQVDDIDEERLVSKLQEDTGPAPAFSLDLFPPVFRTGLGAQQITKVYSHFFGGHEKGISQNMQQLQTALNLKPDLIAVLLETLVSRNLLSVFAVNGEMYWRPKV